MIGGDEEAVTQLAEDCDIDVANYNTVGQLVVSGSEEGVDKAVAEAKGTGATGIKIYADLPANLCQMIIAEAHAQVRFHVTCGSYNCANSHSRTE